ncbi:MAG TPA: hypothetical protein VGD43_10410, partial [Micromonospora sp.]
MSNVDSVATASALRHALSRDGTANLIDAELGALLPASDVRADATDFARRLGDLGVRHEQKVIPVDPRPFVITRPAFTALADRFARLFVLLELAIDRYLDDPEVRRFFALAPRHDRLVRLGARHRPRIRYCRYDFTLAPDGRPRIYELNTHCPASATYGTHFATLLRDSRGYAALGKAGLRSARFALEEPGSFAAAMLAAADDANHPVRTVAVLNSRHLTMTTELDHIAGQFRSLGRTAVRCHVEDLRYDGRRLHLDGLPVDLTYNKFDDSHGPDAFECAFSRTEQEVRDYVRAYRDGAVFTVNSFPSMYLPEQKSMLAFLHSPLFRAGLTAADRDLVDEIVPETVVVRHADDDQLRRFGADRGRYVLKRSLDTRGRSLVIGRSVPAGDWERALLRARSAEAGDDWVVQELAPPLVSTTRPADGGPARTVHTSLACFLFADRPVGLIVRTSVEETTNVGR